MDNNAFSRSETSFLVCIGLVATYLLLPNDRATSIYFTAAIGVMVSVGAGLLLESGGRLLSLIRTDVLMLVALYGLTLVEFFFPQEDLNGILGPEKIHLRRNANFRKDSPMTGCEMTRPLSSQE